MANEQDSFPLADAIASLRRELDEAAQRARCLPRNARFRIAEVEVELSVVVEDSREAAGAVGWCVLKANAGISAKDAVTHKVTLKLDVGSREVSSEEETD